MEDWPCSHDGQPRSELVTMIANEPVSARKIICPVFAACVDRLGAQVNARIAVAKRGQHFSLAYIYAITYSHPMLRVQ